MVLWISLEADDRRIVLTFYGSDETVDIPSWRKQPNTYMLGTPIVFIIQ